MRQRVAEKEKKGREEARGAGIREGILRMEEREELVSPRGHRSHASSTYKGVLMLNCFPSHFLLLYKSPHPESPSHWGLRGS